MNQIQLFPTGFHVEKISHVDAMSIISNFHYMKGASPASQHWGAFIDGVLIGVVSYSVPVGETVRSMLFGEKYKDNVKELSRLCLVPNCPIPASKIVSQSIKKLNEWRQKNNFAIVHGIISYADSGQGHHGGVYQSMSWIYTGDSVYNQNKYHDQTGRARHHRQNGYIITPEMAKSRGWTVKRVKSIKHRYIKIIGSKSQKKFFRKCLKLNNLPYPKPVRKS